METVRVEQLEAKSTFPRGLYSRFGVRLLAPGVALTERMHRALLRSRQGDVSIGRPTGRIGDPARRGTAAAPAAGPWTVADEPSANEPDAPGADPARLAAIRCARLRRDADGIAAARAARWERAPMRIAVGLDPLPIERGEPETRDAAQIRAVRRAAADVAGRLITSLTESGAPDVREATNLIEDLMGWMSRDAAVFARLALTDPREPDALASHAASTCVLSIGIAARLRWPRRDVRAAGLCGLLADAGMALVPQTVRSAARPLSDVEINRVRRHPAYTLALIEHVETVPLTVRIGVCQHHEREDGSGYPRRLRSGSIHDAARVVGVADAYAGAIARRPYRTPARPFSVIQGLIDDVRAGRRDRRTVGALIETVGLFPVGSFVRLRDGRIGEVVGCAGPGHTDRPIIRLWRGDAPDGSGPILDLSAALRAELCVAGAVDSPVDEPAPV